MINGIFINLPVKDLQRSINFFSKLGFMFNQQFTDETATCMIVSDTISVMLVTEEKFLSFSPNQICDTTKNTEVLNCLQVESKERVKELVSLAVAAGGSNYKESQDHGFMYGHGFRDLDGHVWELLFMQQQESKK